MEIIGLIIVILLFIIGMAGIIYPILPGAIAIYIAFFVYGFLISFSPFGTWFWLIQTIILIVLFIADYVVNAWGVKKYGGTKSSVIGSTIGLIVGPFVIPAFGLIIGPFLGAAIGEFITGVDMKQALKVGWGSLLGLFSSVVMKIILQTLMIILFIVWVISN